MKIVRILFILIIFSFTIPLTGQIDSIVENIKRIRTEIIQIDKNIDLILSKNDSLQFFIEQFLSTKNSFYYPLEIQFLGDIFSPDGKFRIINWNILLDKEYQYFGYIQTHDEKNTASRYFKLENVAKQYNNNIENKTFTMKKWYGMLYYQIVLNKRKKKNEYILLAWNGGTTMLNFKIIEPFYFNRKGYPIFGANRILYKNKKQKRIVLKYANEGTLTLSYNPIKDMIIFDNLVPMEEGMDGIYEFYISDFSYNALKRKKDGNWEFIENIKIKGEKSDKPFYSPNKRIKKKR